MPPLKFSGKSLSSLQEYIDRKRALGLLTRATKTRGKPVGQCSHVRLLSSFARSIIPCGDKWAATEEENTMLFRRFGNSIQNRNFLGVADGEEGNDLSKTYEEKRVMGYSPEQLFLVVAAVDMYQDFLPWCHRSQIIQRHSDSSFDAELQIGFKFLVESYTSHVEMIKPKSIKTTVSKSALFDHLINLWEFNPGPLPGTCDLSFYVDFKFHSPLYRQVASMFFKEVVSQLVSSFSDRCRLIYGPAVKVIETPYGEQRL